MIKAITVTNHLNESIVLELMRPEDSGFIVLGVEGLGPVKAQVNLTEMAGLDGGVYNSARASSRNIVFRLGFLEYLSFSQGGPSPSEGPEVPTPGMSIEDRRQQCYKYFPLKRRIKVQIETDNRTAETYGYVESNEPDIFSKEEGAIISVLCPRSYLYGTMGEDTTFGFVDPLFQFPFSSTLAPQLNFGTITLSTEQSILYDGDAEVGIVITITATGAAAGVSISELGTLNFISIDSTKLIAITGFGIMAGDVITISTVAGDKYARLLRGATTYNIINALGPNPYWFKLQKGDNIYTYNATSGLTNLQFSIQNEVAYEGI